MSLWAKELLKKVILKSFLIFNSVVILYFLIDFSINSFRLSNAPILDLIRYYLIQVSNHFDLFLPIAFLISVLKTLTDMNVNKELLALFSAGLSKKFFLTPLYLIATLFSVICLYNHEIIIPKSSCFMNEFQVKYFSNKNKNKRKKVNSISLNDHSHLIFSKYDFENKTLEDVFWIKNFNDIWHFDKVELSNPITGYYIDCLIRDQNDLLIKNNSYTKLEIPNLIITEDVLRDTFIPLSNHPLSRLLFYKNNPEKNAISSTKIILSLSFFLVVMCIAPQCLAFSRLFSPMLIFSISIFSFVFFYIMIKTLAILCINQVISCFFALWFPCILLSFLGLYRYLRNNL